MSNNSGTGFFTITVREDKDYFVKGPNTNTQGPGPFAKRKAWFGGRAVISPPPQSNKKKNYFSPDFLIVQISFFVVLEVWKKLQVGPVYNPLMIPSPKGAITSVLFSYLFIFHLFKIISRLCNIDYAKVILFKIPVLGRGMKVYNGKNVIYKMYKTKIRDIQEEEKKLFL